MSTMWQTLTRARRRLSGGARGASPPEGFTSGQATDLTFALNRADLDRLINALMHVPGVEPGRPDTPARLEAALRVVIAEACGCGSPAVTRRPAGVYTPETWRIEVIGADRRTELTLERALQDGGPA
jgi:hypothetical protein